MPNLAAYGVAVPTTVLIAIPTVALLLPQFLGVLQQAEIIVGHAFFTHEGKKRGLIDAVVQHTRHLNDFPIQWPLIILAAVGAVILLVRRIWWPLAVWLLLVVSIVHSSATFGGPIGGLIGKFSDLFYSDPRRLSAVVAMLLTAAAGIGVFTLAALLGRRRSLTAVVAVAVCLTIGVAYLPRHQFLFGEKYDSVIIDDPDLAAFAHLASLPGAPRHPHRQRQHRRHRVDVRDRRAAPAVDPLRRPRPAGPWLSPVHFLDLADDADTDPRVAEAVKALNIRYAVTSTPVVRGFVMPDGLLSLDRSRSWEKIYDNGEARIYEWRGNLRE